MFERGLLFSIAAATALVLAVVQPLPADGFKPSFAYDGHWWNKQSPEVKTIALSSMIDAVRYGYLGGYNKGIQDASKSTSREDTLKFSKSIKVYVQVADFYYASSEHLAIPLVYVVACLADPTFDAAKCKPYGAQRPLPTPTS